MAATTGLKDHLQEVTALMGLLRADLQELSAARLDAQRAPVFDHIRWIAGRLDEVTPRLSTVDDTDEDRPRESAESERRNPELADAMPSSTEATSEPAASPESSEPEPATPSASGISSAYPDPSEPHKRSGRHERGH